MIEIILNENTKSARSKWSWTKMQKKRADDLVAIFEKYKKHWPLTERFAFYRLISEAMVDGDHWNQFGRSDKPQIDIYGSALSPLLKWMRIDGLLPWDSIVDDQRLLTGKVGFEDTEQFVYQELSDFLTGYRKCLAHKQKYHVEIWVEKATIIRLIKPVTDKYCRRLMYCKGYNSITFQADFYERASEALNRDQIPVVLYFGDWDPSGVNMMYAAAQTLVDELGLVGTEFYRCGINPEHFKDLIKRPQPIKDTDSRSKRFIEEHGTTAYEVDAFEPDELQALVEKSILKFTDIEIVKDAREQEPLDMEFLRDLRDDVVDLIITRGGL